MSISRHPVIRIPRRARCTNGSCFFKVKTDSLNCVVVVVVEVVLNLSAL
jgi:hypothetical protein